jgi:hypothetical protein
MDFTRHANMRARTASTMSAATAGTVTNSIGQGPSAWTDLAGWAFHFWNGISFAGIYILLVGRRCPWLAVLYGLTIGTIFLISPATTATGAGVFGLSFGVGMLITVYIAHFVFGSLLGLLAVRSSQVGDWILSLVHR